MTGYRYHACGLTIRVPFACPALPVAARNPGCDDAVLARCFTQILERVTEPAR
jgi:hypothetical protein